MRLVAYVAIARLFYTISKTYINNIRHSYSDHVHLYYHHIRIYICTCGCGYVQVSVCLLYVKPIFFRFEITENMVNILPGIVCFRYVPKTCSSASLRRRHQRGCNTIIYEQLIRHVFSIALKAFQTLIRIIKPILWYLKQLNCCAVVVVGFVCSFLFTIITKYGQRTQRI